MYFVLCLDINSFGKTVIVLATQRGFIIEQEAQVYANSVSKSRQPFIVKKVFDTSSRRSAFFEPNFNKEN